VTEQVTAQALVDAAEGRFAADGFDGASLRAVMRDADADPGSIHYHFGGRESLGAAVLDRVLRPLNDRRLELLDAATAESAGAAVSLDRLVEALIRPDVEAAIDLSGRGGGRAQLVGMIYLDRATFVQDEVAKHFSPTAQRFIPHLMRALPDIAGAVVSWRVRWFVFGVLGALLSDEAALQELHPDELVERLVLAASAALAASVSKEGPLWK